MGQRGVYKDRYQLQKTALRAIEKKQNFKQQLGIMIPEVLRNDIVKNMTTWLSGQGSSHSV
jgi:hypothetical protein